MFISVYYTGSLYLDGHNKSFFIIERILIEFVIYKV